MLDGYGVRFESVSLTHVVAWLLLFATSTAQVPPHLEVVRKDVTDHLLFGLLVLGGRVLDDDSATLESLIKPVSGEDDEFDDDGEEVTTPSPC